MDQFAVGSSLDELDRAVLLQGVVSCEDITPLEVFWRAYLGGDTADQPKTDLGPEDVVSLLIDYVMRYNPHYSSAGGEQVENIERVIGSVLFADLEVGTESYPDEPPPQAALRGGGSPTEAVSDGSSSSRPRSTEWMDRAACKGEDIDLFFDSDKKREEEAKKICGSCPVRSDCLDYGQHVNFGVWGGESAADRRRSRNRKGKQNQSSAV